MKIIDSHAHIAKVINGVGSRGELYPLGNGMVSYADGTSFRIIPEGMGDIGFTPEMAIEIMDKHNVEKAVLLQGNYLGFQNLHTYEAIKKYPERFVGACTYDPFCVNQHLIRKHLFDDLGFKILKLEMSNGSGMMANHHTIDLDGEMMNEVYKYASDRGVTIVFDIGRPQNNCYQIDKLLNVVKKYKDTTFVICHLLAHQVGDIDLLEENLPKFKLPNVYFDIASVDNNTKPEVFPYPTASKFIRRAIDILGSNRLMWGSDMPAGICKDTYSNKIKYLMDNNLFTQKELEDIFYNTANKVYFKK